MKQANSKTPAPSCPTCGDPLEDMLPNGERASGCAAAIYPGASLLCVTCGALLRVDDLGAVRVMTEAETLTLPPFVAQVFREMEACRQALARQSGREGGKA